MKVVFIVNAFKSSPTKANSGKKIKITHDLLDHQDPEKTSFNFGILNF